jgi:anti-sigma B factor antagonist
MAHVQPFRVVVAEDGPSRLRLEVFGEVDLLVAPDLLDAILSAGVASTRPRTLVVDLAAVTFMDSSGLGALLEAHRRLPGLDCQLLVVDLPLSVRALMASTGLAQVLPIEVSEPDPAEPEPLAS